MFHSTHLTILALIIACLMPVIFAGIAKMLGKFSLNDNQHPREFLQALASTNPPAYRAHCAQQNSFEILPIFLTSVLLAMILLVPQSAINKIAWLFIGLRVAYGFAYIANFSLFRSFLWFLSLACPLVLFYLCYVVI